jgi:hypothetical protein
MVLAARHCSSHGPFPLRHYCGLSPCMHLLR